MYRIRFHGRGGQGIKTAGRILGNAFFHEGFEVQDAPRYGAERRGAPIFAYVRADKKPIDERGVITNPDLIIVADDSLVTVPAAGVLQGLDDHAVLLINSHESAETWKHRLNSQAKVLVLPVKELIQDRAELPYISAACVGAAARLLGFIGQSALRNAIEEELSDQTPEKVASNRTRAIEAFECMAAFENCVHQKSSVSALDYQSPEWVDLTCDDARMAAPTIYANLTSVEVKTGLWRTMRPVIEYGRCHHCWWICSSACPHKVINVHENKPEIDYDHCVGCMVCVAQCPSHAIKAVAESQALQEARESA